jgi:hypothetical protein
MFLTRARMAPPMPQAQFDASKSFDIVSRDSGRRYRIFYRSGDECPRDRRRRGATVKAN